MPKNPSLRLLSSDGSRILGGIKDESEPQRDTANDAELMCIHGTTLWHNVFSEPGRRGVLRMYSEFRK